MKHRFFREIARLHAMFRAVAPFLPPSLVRVLRRMKRGLSSSRVFRFVVRRPQADRRRPSCEVSRLFDAAFYRDQTGSNEGENELLVHYRRFGWQSGLDPNHFFDVRWYLSRARELEVLVNGDPFEHYLQEGWRIGLEPNCVFDGHWYASKVGLEMSCPLVHYLDYGQWAGIPPSPALEKAMEPGYLPVPKLEGKLAGISLPGPEIRLVTLDFWDTLVVRTRPADSAKLMTARRIIFELKSAASAFDLFALRVRIEMNLCTARPHGEYELSEVIRLLLESLTNEVDNNLVDWLVQAELEDECRYTKLNPLLALYLRDLRDLRDGRLNLEIAVLSDFYMKGSSLRSILEHHGVDCDGLQFISSCEYSASKRLGALFTEAHRIFGVPASAHLHIGDNVHSDVEMARMHGVQPIHIPVEKVYPGPGELSLLWFTSNPFEEGCSRIGSLLAGQKKRQLSDKRAVFAGSRNAFLPLALIFAAAQRANERGLDRIFYVSREGAFLSELHRGIRDEHPELKFPHPVHLEVSRRSTFGPSLTCLDGPNLDRLWSQYPHQSIFGLLSSLGLDPLLVSDDIRRFGFVPDDLITDIRSNARVREFLADRKVGAIILGHIGVQRELLTRYLRGRGVTDNEALVVDLGWRGTIQDNFAHILEDVHFHGVYMGLFPYLNKQPLNASKEALAFDGNFGHPFEHVSPPAVLESPFTPNIPSAVRYADDLDGRILVVGEDETGRAKDLITSFQEGVHAATPFLVDHFLANGYDFEILRSVSKEFLKRYFEDPDPGVADIWFNSAHDDTFGAMNHTPFEKRLDPSSIIRAKGDLSQVPPAMGSGWPIGYMRWLPAHSLALTSHFIGNHYE
jgi:FMN phosphatase YigB (HAD superfamily)